MADIAPSLLAADFSKLCEEVKALDRAGIKVLHLDSMDGMFVPNITFGPLVIKSVRRHTKAVFDVHLMIEEPSRYLDEFVDAGADIITIHFEACKNPLETLWQISERGIKAGIAIKPETPIKEIINLLDKVDLVLIMAVNPGFGGQTFMPIAIEKLEELCRLKKENGYTFIIEADGGINAENIGRVAAAGAELLVTGSAFFKVEDYAAQVRIFEAALQA